MNIKNKSSLLLSTGLILMVLLGLGACKEIAIYEHNTPVPGYNWKRNFTANGKFKITDTTAFYNIYIVIRHTDSYAYNNIWVNFGVKSPGDSMRYQKLDLSLGNDRSGWEGVGMNDIWEVRKLMFGQPRRFVEPGVYEFTINQIMRDDPLQHILSAGLRVEKAP
ncbi:MAG: gliding motility lipoprotein GldH [Ferruginibacter sp.]|nr:gliding motility lipoprotein GldH [Ferruginibacter sp.]